MEELTRVTIEHRLEEVGVARWASTFLPWSFVRYLSYAGI